MGNNLKQMPNDLKKYADDIIDWVKEYNAIATADDVIAELKQERGVQFKQEEEASLYEYVRNKLRNESEETQSESNQQLKDKSNQGQYKEKAPVVQNFVSRFPKPTNSYTKNKIVVKFKYFIIGIFIFLILTNPGAKRFKEYMGYNNYSGFRRTQNWILLSIYEDRDSEKYLGIVFNFLKLKS